MLILTLPYFWDNVNLLILLLIMGEFCCFARLVTSDQVPDTESYVVECWMLWCVSTSWALFLDAGRCLGTVALCGSRQDWSSSWSRVSHFPLLKQGASIYSTRYTLRIEGFPVWPVGTGTALWPVWMLGTIPANRPGWVFPQPPGVSSHTHTPISTPLNTCRGLHGSPVLSPSSCLLSSGLSYEL